MKNNRSARQTYARFVPRASTIGLLLVTLAVLFWPTRARRVERLLTRLSETLACDGPLTVEREKAVRSTIASHLSQQTTIAMTDPDAMNGTFPREELERNFGLLCASTSHFRVNFSQVVVDVSEHAANARADVAVEYVYLGRTQREHRQARFTLHLLGDDFRVASVELGPNVVNQPEPRP